MGSQGVKGAAPSLLLTKTCAHHRTLGDDGDIESPPNHHFASGSHVGSIIQAIRWQHHNFRGVKSDFGARASRNEWGKPTPCFPAGPPAPRPRNPSPRLDISLGARATRTRVKVPLPRSEPVQAKGWNLRLRPRERPSVRPKKSSAGWGERTNVPMLRARVVHESNPDDMLLCTSVDFKAPEA